ncbi:hypothetical protein N7452_006440 [Penicillium brevicompactum]|uniref:Uncharacterized protein n=1 Tax=Penicillium brevicompactum TaxID=5074 RepID=A0A9W9UG40_PENBR|nr:hypothetical protein N7452_006440 [Penicillium brevicompactum]
MSASFSRRLRRRFSRESKHSGEHRIAFPFSLKSKPSIVKTENELAIFQDAGSSLMNARAYDSDAQCVGSPQHIESANGSPSPGSRRMGQNNMSQSSREFDSIPRLKNGSGQNSPGSQRGNFGGYPSSTPHGSMRGHLGQNDARFAARVAGNQSTTSLNTQRSDELGNFARSHPHLHPSQEHLTPPTHEVNRRQGAFLTGSGENLQNLVVDWAKYMDSSANGPRNASSESLGRQSPQIMKPKRDRLVSTPTRSEARVPNLSDLDLSHRAKASDLTSGPASANASITELPRAGRYGLPMVSLENVQSSMRSGSSTIVGPETPVQSTPHFRDVSSFYSRQSDEVFGSASTGIHSLRAHAANVMESLPNIQGRLVGDSGNMGNAPAASDQVAKNKFDPHQGAITPKSAEGYTTPVTNEGMRRVSPGWMTGGRRMGYGYTLVDSDEASPRQDGMDDAQQANAAYGRQAFGSATGVVSKHGMNGSIRQRTSLQSPVQTSASNGASKTNSSRHSPSKVPTNPKDESIASPIKWAKTKRNSLRDHGHAPLAVDLASESMFLGNVRSGGVQSLQQHQHMTPTRVDYVEDDGNFASRWSRGSLSSKRQSQSHKKNDTGDRRESYTPEISPSPNRRFSMDQSNRRPSVYFDPASQRSADKLNGQPSRSRSGRWILRFSRIRDSRRRSSKPPKEPSPDSSADYEECVSNGHGGADSFRSDVAADLANEYQECIQMPGAFYGSGWASRTSLIVDAE